jgi:hypothetical protein
MIHRGSRYAYAEYLRRTPRHRACRDSRGVDMQTRNQALVGARSAASHSAAAAWLQQRPRRERRPAAHELLRGVRPRLAGVEGLAAVLVGLSRLANARLVGGLGRAVCRVLWGLAEPLKCGRCLRNHLQRCRCGSEGGGFGTLTLPHKGER